MNNEIEKYSRPDIENRIFAIRDTQVMIDFHLADLYQVETKRINEQVKRNNERFPKNFMFQLNADEWNDLQSQIATIEESGNLQSQNATAKRRTLPYAFTEQGVAMLSAVLRSETAVKSQQTQAFSNGSTKWNKSKLKPTINSNKSLKPLKIKALNPNGAFFTMDRFSMLMCLWQT
jgi:hypothetical protein